MSSFWVPVAPRVFVATVDPHRVNIGLVVGDDAALLVDAGTTPEQGAQLLRRANEHTTVPVTHVVITHDHVDHTDGLGGMAEVVTIGHENLSRAHPTLTFSMAHALDLGSQRVEFLHFGSAHTSSDVIVFVPAANVVFTGDLLEEGAPPHIDDTGSLANWPMVLDGIIGASNEHTSLVPGHGAVVNRDFAVMQRADLALVFGQAEALIHRGISLPEAADAQRWPFEGALLDDLLRKAYAEHAANGLVPRTQLPIISA